MHRLHDFLMKAIGKLLQKFFSPEQKKVKISVFHQTGFLGVVANGLLPTEASKRNKL